MKLYLIDYENVHEDGLRGIEKLAAEDTVIVFYSENVKNISFERHVEILRSKAKIEHIQTHKVAKNYLDFQLSTFLGYKIGKGQQGEIYVISKDTGFDSVIDFWKGRSVSIFRQEQIEAKAAAQKQAGKAQGSEKQTGKAQGQEKQKKVSAAIALPESVRKKVRAAVKSDKVSAGQYSTIYKAFDNMQSKQELHNILMQSFEHDKATRIYNHVKDIFEDYKE